MKTLSSFTVVVALAIAVFFLGRLEQFRLLLGVIVPYAAITTFLVGVSYRVVRWSLSPVPFRIPTTCGQQKSLPWIKVSWLENPYRTTGVIFRMVLEILLFRSLFRNTKAEIRQGPRADLWREQIPLARRAGVPLVLPLYFPEAPALLYRARSALGAFAR